MLKGIISKAMTTLLDEYMKPISSKQVNVEALKGNTTLKDLEFQEKALEKLKQPFTIDVGTIKTFFLSIQFTKLETSPTIVTIDDVFLRLRFDWEFFYSKSDEITGQSLIAASKNAVDKQMGDIKTAIGIIDRIIDNLYVSAKNVKIELVIPHSGGEAIIGFELPEFYISSSERMVQGDRSSFIKELKIEGMNVYIDCRDNGEENNEEHSKIVSFPSTCITFTHYRDMTSAVLNFVEGEFQEIGFSLDKKQILHLSRIVKHFEKVSKMKKYRECEKPKDTENLQEMFSYVYRCANHNNRRPKVDVGLALEFLKNRKKYYKLYSSTLVKAKNIFTNYAEKFNKVNENLSSDAKKLLAEYSKKRHEKEEKEKEKKGTEEERKEMEKRSEVFIKSLTSFQSVLSIDKFTLSLTDHNKPFAVFTNSKMNIRVMSSEFYQQFNFGINDIAFTIKDKNIFITEDSKSNWFAFRINYGEEIAQLNFEVDPLGIDLSMEDIKSIIKYCEGIDFPSITIPEEAPDITEPLISFYNKKVWNITFDMKGFPISFDYNGNKFALKLTDLLISNDDPEKTRKDEQLFIYLASSLGFDFDGIPIISPSKSTFKFGSNYIEDTMKFESNLIIAMDESTVDLRRKLLLFIEPYLPALTRFFTSPEFLHEMKIIINFITSLIRFISNRTNIKLTSGPISFSLGDKDVNLLLNKLVSNIEATNKSLEYADFGIHGLDINATNNFYPLIEVESFAFAFKNDLFDMRGGDFSFTILPVIGETLKKIPKVDFGEPCFDVGATMKEKVLSLLTPPINLKLRMKYSNITLNIASIINREDVASIFLPSVIINNNMLKGAFGIILPEFSLNFKEKRFLKLTDTSLMFSLMFNRGVWEKETNYLASNVMELDFNDFVSTKSIHPVIFIDLGELDLDFSNSEVSTFVSIFNEFFPIINGLHISGKDMSMYNFDVSLFVDFRFMLKKLSFRISDLNLGINFNGLQFSVKGSQDASIFFNLNKIELDQSIVKCQIIKVLQDNVITLKTSKKQDGDEQIYEVNGCLSPIFINVHLAIMEKIIDYFSSSSFWDLKIPSVTVGEIKLPNVDFKLPRMKFIFNASDIDVVIPMKTDVTLFDEVLSMHLGFSVDTEWPQINAKLFVGNCKFTNMQMNFDFPMMIDDLSLYLEANVKENDVKAGMDKDICISISPEDIYTLNDIISDFNSIIPMPEIRLSMPALVLPAVHITTKNVVFQICEQNSSNADKETPLIKLCVNPIGFNVVTSPDITTYCLGINFMCEAYDKCTGNFDVIIEENTLNVLLKITDKATVQSKENLVDASIDFEKPLIFNITQNLLKEMIEVKLNTRRHSKDLVPTPDFWIKNTCNKEISINAGESHLFLVPGNIVPTFFISHSMEMEVIIGSNKFYFKPDDLIYPIQLSNNVFVTKHSHMNGIMIEFLTPFVIKNALEFTIYAFIIGEKDTFFMDAIPPGEIRSLPNFLAYYTFTNTGKLSKNEIRSLKRYILGPTMESSSGSSDVISDDITVSYLDENGKMKDICVVACLKEDYYLGVKVLEVRSEFTIRNLIPTAMQYEINGTRVMCNEGETVTIPFIDHGADYVSITASIDGENFPPYSWVYFKREYAQKVPVNYQSASSTPYLACVATQDHSNGFNTSLTIYSPTVIFNSSSQVITIGNTVVSPGIFILWCPREYFIRPDYVKASVKIEGRTTKLDNAIDCVSAGSNEMIMIPNNKSTLYTPLRYISRRQGGDYTRTVGITITDAIRIDNQLDLSVSFLPETNSRDIVYEDIKEFIIDEKSLRIMKIISESKRYTFTVADFSACTVVDFSVPGEFVFALKTRNRRLIVSMKIVDEVNSTAVYIKKCHRPPFLIRNNLDCDISVYQLNEENSVFIKKGTYEEYALENPLGKKQIIVTIHEIPFIISLEEASRKFTISKDFDGKRVTVTLFYVKGQRRIVFNSETIRNEEEESEEQSNEVSISTFKINLESFGISLIDRNFREIAYAGVNGIKIKASLFNEKIMCTAIVDSFGLYDQNPTASKPSIIRSENKNFFELDTIFPTDVLQSKEIIYLGIRVQPIHIFVSPMFISDIAQFAREIDFNVASGASGSISPFPNNSSTSISTTIHIVWLEISNIKVYFSICYDVWRRNFSEKAISLFSKIPNLSERIFVLPAFFVSDVTNPLKRTGQEIIGDYIVNGLDYALSNMGALGSIVKFFGAVGFIKSMLKIQHQPFQTLDKVNLITTDAENRTNVYGCFNKHTLNFLSSNLKSINEVNKISRVKSLCDIIISGNVEGIQVRGVGLTESGLIGLSLATPVFNERVAPINRIRYPLCNMMNRVQLYKAEYSISLTSLVTNGYGRALFVGEVVSEDEVKKNVFITKTHICIMSEESSILLVIELHEIKEISESSGIITLSYEGKENEEIIQFKSDANSAIILFILTTKNSKETKVQK